MNSRTRNLLKNLWEGFAQYRAFQFYLILLFMLVAQTVIFVYLAQLPKVPLWGDVLLLAFSDAALILIPYAIIPPLRRWTFGIGVTLVTFWQYSNILYSRTYFEFMPLRSYFLFENVNNVLIDSIIGSIHWEDLFLILPTIIVFVLYYKYYKQYVLSEKRICKKAILIFTTIICIWFNLWSTYCYYKQNKYNGSYLENIVAATIDRWQWQSLYYTPYSSYYFKSGLIAYVYHGICGWSPTIELTTEQEKEVKKFISTQPQYTDNKYGKLNQGKNLIFVVAESLSSWVIDHKVNGHEVTPILNSYFKGKEAFTIRNMHSQVMSGRTSDGHFIYNTGLLPCQTTQTAIYFGDVPYPSLGKALSQKGYNTINILCDEKSFWNQYITSKSYGFKHVYERTDYYPYSDVPMNQIDKIILPAATKICVKENNTPFYAMIVTLSMHYPWKNAVNAPDWLLNANISTEMRNYLSVAHFFDKQLGNFIAELKQNGIYDNSVIVIAGDHEGLYRNNSNSEKMVPAIILNSGYNITYDEVVGQVDLYPTLLDIMGANHYTWKGLGHSLLRYPVESAVMSSHEIIGNTSSPLAERQRQSWIISHLIIASRYFEKHRLDMQ